MLDAHERNLLYFTENMAKVFPDEQFKDYASSQESQSIQNGFNTYVNEKASTNNTMAVWLVYMEMVQTLIFIQATRENNWELHLSAVRSMLPWFFVADHVNYARYGSIYWLEMICMDTTHPGTQ